MTEYRVGDQISVNQWNMVSPPNRGERCEECGDYRDYCIHRRQVRRMEHIHGRREQQERYEVVGERVDV